MDAFFSRTPHHNISLSSATTSALSSVKLACC